jgi:acetyltransferase-like isoleucine patch superfamily enzyme
MVSKVINYLTIAVAKIATVVLYKWRMRYCGSNTIIERPLHFTPKHIIMGNGVYIWKNARIEAVTIYEGQIYNPEIIFEDGVSVQQNLHLTCAERISIGKNTAIAANVTITDIHHPYDDISIPIERQKLKVFPVKIGDDCKIYNNVVVLQGITIGNHVTVAANSVVNKSIPDYCVVAGIPARIIKRYNFEQKQWERTDTQGEFFN